MAEIKDPTWGMAVEEEPLARDTYLAELIRKEVSTWPMSVMSVEEAWQMLVAERDQLRAEKLGLERALDLVSRMLAFHRGDVTQ